MKLTESHLRKIIKEELKRVLNEEDVQYVLNDKMGLLQYIDGASNLTPQEEEKVNKLRTFLMHSPTTEKFIFTDDNPVQVFDVGSGEGGKVATPGKGANYLMDLDRQTISKLGLQKRLDSKFGRLLGYGN